MLTGMPLNLLILQKNIKNLNLVIPEWLFIDPNTDQLDNTVDPKGA
jgi:hypothetical protein